MTDLRPPPQKSKWQSTGAERGSVEEILAKNGPLSFLFKDAIETMLKEEMTDHLSYEHNDVRAKKNRQLSQWTL